MITIYYLIFSSLFFVLVIGAVLGTLYRKELAIQERAVYYFGIDQVKKEEQKKDFPLMLALKRFNDRVKQLIAKAISAQRQKELEQRLREAGYQLKLKAVDFRFLQVMIGGFLFLLVYLLLGKADTNLISSLLLSGIVAALGMYYPSFYLSSIIKKRRFEIQKGMPDFFDMVNLSIEAGMGLDSSIIKVCSQTKGPLSEEFLKTIEDMKLGKSRREALADLRKRVPVPQFQSIITSLIQADLLGVGMAKVLRSLTERIREQRTQLAREQAMKAPVKMIFPMMFFIFPAIFIVLLGPLVIYMLETFL